MDILQKAISSGAIGYLLSNRHSDISAWVVHNILPSPSNDINVLTKLYFGIPALDDLLGGISGLWEIHGRKSSGKTFLCSRLCRNCKGKVMYINISGVPCFEFRERLRDYKDPDDIDIGVYTDIKSLINYLYSIIGYCKYEVLLIEGISPLLFSIQESREIVKEFESIIKRLSLKVTVVLTCVSNDSGNLIGHYLWNDAVTNNLHINQTDPSTYEVTWYKYNIQTIAFLSD